MKLAREVLGLYTVLHAIETSGPGGAETVVLELATHLDRSRFRSLVLIPPGTWLPQVLASRGIPTTVVESTSWQGLLKTLTQVIKTERVDLIHSHLPDQNFYSCVAGKMTGRKTIATYHGDVVSRTGKSRRAFKEWVIRHTATRVVAVSEFLKQKLLASGVPVCKVVRIYNGVDTGKFSVARTGRLLKDLGCPRGAKLVGMIANLRKSKGLEYFVQAARKVCDSFPEAYFVLVGETEPALEQKISGLVRELNLADRLVLLGFREDVAEILSELDVFVLSSVSEGLSIATIEAMAAGKPVVVTRSGGPQEIVEDRETGLLVPASNAEALAAGIVELLSSPELAGRLGKSARAAVEVKFSRTRMLQEYETLYEHCLTTS